MCNDHVGHEAALVAQLGGHPRRRRAAAGHLRVVRGQGRARRGDLRLVERVVGIARRQKSRIDLVLPVGDHRHLVAAPEQLGCQVAELAREVLMYQQDLHGRPRARSPPGVPKAASIRARV